MTKFALIVLIIATVLFMPVTDVLGSGNPLPQGDEGVLSEDGGETWARVYVDGASVTYLGEHYINGVTMWVNGDGTVSFIRNGLVLTVLYLPLPDFE